MNIYPLKEKLQTYNFKVHEVYGHNVENIVELFENGLSKDRANIIIAKTIKGRGISFMENKNYKVIILKYMKYKDIILKRY